MEYKHLQLPTPDGQIYVNDHMGTTEAMLPPEADNRTAHGPALLENADGDLLCCWFSGTYEGSADCHIIVSRLEKGSDKWSKPIAISNDMERSEQNPSLFNAPNGEIWAMYTSQEGRRPDKDNMQYTSIVKKQVSKDGGRSWGPAETVFGREGTFCRQQIQILANGNWIFGNWLCSDSVNGLAGDPTVFQISEDEGKTWRQVDMPDSHGRVHANVVELDDKGHLAAFMRSREADYIYRSESMDFGETWSKPVPTILPNNNSSISAIKLKSGRLAIAYNPTHAPKLIKGGAAWPGLRCPVAVALSEDGGLSFPMIRHMELGEGYVGDENSTNNLQYEYPHLIQASDGRLHLAFAYRTRIGVKWMSFTEEDVMGAKRQTEGVYNPTAAVIR